ncbi:MAG: sucrose-phosphate phosphatase [Chromatiales bacterium]|nr:sucrose-phosphate phosphatase [Chromatiales bacterium]
MTDKKDSTRGRGLYVALFSIHGLIRGQDLELGRDSDTGGQTKYVVELARALAEHPDVERVDLFTRQVVDARVSKDYAQPVEQIAGRAQIVRIPCGPEGYLRKELLWPYLREFIDNTLAHFRRIGRIPDVLHGHYADAGHVATRLARLLGVLLVQTGHSLGRIKRERLLKSGLSEAEIEAAYNMSQRIAAEEEVLAHANLVITSTSQEVEQQYAVYEHYRPERMLVNPPGTDLEHFHPPRRGDYPGTVLGEINRFLQQPKKPMVLALSRPDPRKNIGTLIHAFGGNQRLRDLANLVIVAGSRDDIREIDEDGPREVLTEMLLLIDRYDLYGQVAYPKHIDFDSVAEIYRIATRSKGVFVNPAYTEPFGLTLIEAAASGLPMVATNDGGPRDIREYCRNGLLVDPYDAKAMGEAILEVVADREQWRKYSARAVRGAHEHFSWSGHARKYVSRLKKLIGPKRAGSERWNRLTVVDHALISDIDNTLIGDRAALRELLQALKSQRDHIAFGVATGRRLELTLEALKEWKVPIPDVLVTSVGSEIYYGPNLVQDEGWSEVIDHEWDRAALQALLDPLPGLRLQPEIDQRRFKLSYFIDPDAAWPVEDIEGLMKKHGLKARVIFSHGEFLDLLPVRASKGAAIEYLARKWGLALDHVLVAGDSGNDRDMLEGPALGVVVGNHAEELKSLAAQDKLYFASATHAGGILEGLRHYGFVGEA